MRFIHSKCIGLLLFISSLRYFNRKINCCRYGIAHNGLLTQTNACIRCRQKAWDHDDNAYTYVNNDRSVKAARHAIFKQNCDGQIKSPKNTPLNTLPPHFWINVTYLRRKAYSYPIMFGKFPIGIKDIKYLP